MSLGQLIINSYDFGHSGIGRNAFKGCTNLKTYNIDSSGMDAAYTAAGDNQDSVLASLKSQIKEAGIGLDASGNEISGVTVYTQEFIDGTSEHSIVWQAITELNGTRSADTQITLSPSDDPYARKTVKSHIWDGGVITTPATCTATGVKTYHCTDGDCNATRTVKIPIDSNAHKYKTTWSKDATSHWHECAYNSKHITGKANHKWDSGKITKNATTSATGVKTYTCTVCKATKTETIDKLPETSYSKGATEATVDKAITSLKNDADPKGTTFGLLQLKVKKTDKKSITLQWVGAKDAKKFVVYGNNCNTGKKKYKYVKLTTTTKKTVKYTKIKKAKMKGGTFYKFMVVALDKNNKVVATSKTVHVATKGGKTWNYKSVSISKKVIKKAKSLKKGKTLKINAKAVIDNKKIKAKAHRPISYESSNPAIATVTSKGVVKGKKAGTCYVYAYAQNGVFKKLKVTVK